MIRRTPILFVVSVLLIFGWLTIIEAAEVKITASDGAESDRFGCSVSISGDYVIVGAYGDDEGGYSDKGSAYIFKKPVTGWVEMTETIKLTASDGTTNDNFGCSISISGDYAIVGAYGDDNYVGSSYIFSRNGENWNQQAKLTASDGALGDYFGASVSIFGDYAIVGANGEDPGGSAYIFYRSGENWIQQAKLTASDSSSGDNFGSSVSISGDYAIVGASGDDEGGYSDKGSAYIFSHSGESWSQQAKLTTYEKEEQGFFGVSVSISGNYAIVGAYGDDECKGSAYIFKKPVTGWENMTETVKIVDNDCDFGDSFGSSVSIFGNYAIVGAYQDDGVGSMCAFLYNGSSWSQTSKQCTSDGENYGCSVSLSGDYTVVGADCYDEGLEVQNKGSAYIYHSVDDLSLPVEMTSFTAESRSGGVLLEWMTESETENLGFIIQRRQETGDWKQVASYLTDMALEGHGSTSEKHEYQFTDNSFQPGMTYEYRLGDVAYSGKVTWHKEVEVKVAVEGGKLAEGFRLEEIYPNPFNATFTVPLMLGKTSPVKLVLYDVNGRLVKVIEDGIRPAGEYHITVSCQELSSGIYFLKTHVFESDLTKKILLIR